MKFSDQRNMCWVVGEHRNGRPDARREFPECRGRDRHPEDDRQSGMGRVAVRQEEAGIFSSSFMSFIKKFFLGFRAESELQASQG